MLNVMRKNYKNIYYSNSKKLKLKQLTKWYKKNWCDITYIFIKETI